MQVSASNDPAQLDLSTKLSIDRTWLAQERTMLAWIRTATSLITFGFAIYSFFGISTGPGSKHATELGARIFALSLIGIGLTALLAAAIQRRQAIAGLKSIRSDLKIPSLGGIVALLVGALGLLALLVLLLRI